MYVDSLRGSVFEAALELGLIGLLAGPDLAGGRPGPSLLRGH